MVFETPPPPDRMLESLPSSLIEHPLSDECSFSQAELPKQMMLSKSQDKSADDMYGMTNRYRRLKPSPISTLSSSTEHLSSSPTHRVALHIKKTDVSQESDDSLWHNSDVENEYRCIGDNHISIPNTKCLSIGEFYPNVLMNSYMSSSSSASSSDLSSIHVGPHRTNTPGIQVLSSSSSGYDSSLNSIPDQFFPSYPDSNSNLSRQFTSSHLEKQCSFNHDLTSPSVSSLSLSSNSVFFSHDILSTVVTSSCHRKCQMQTQSSSDTDDDSQATTIATNGSPEEQHSKRPRSLPIAIQQSKPSSNDDDTDNSSSIASLCFHSIKMTDENCSRTYELTAVTSTTSTDKLDINEQVLPNQKSCLEHFIMSPTDKVKVQMKYQENDLKNNELKISQPEDIDFKRSKLKAIRVLYQNRINFSNMQSPVKQQNAITLSSRTVNYCRSPLAKRTSNPRLLRSVLSCSVFEVDDEHEVVSSTARTNVNGTREKSYTESFNCLRISFTESLLHGKILPCGVLDGFTLKLGASGLFMPKQVILPVTTFWFNVSEHQAASPYLGYVNLQCLPKRGYHTPTKGTITLALLNPNGTAVHLFLILYDLSDMPPDHRTFIRQRVVVIPENNVSNKMQTRQSIEISSKENLRYLAHIRFVTSQTGKLYMHSDIRLIFARNKLDYDERTGSAKPQLITSTDMPTPKYWLRK